MGSRRAENCGDFCPRDFTVAVLLKGGRCPCCVGRAGSTVACRGGDSRDPTASFVRKCAPGVVVQRQVPGLVRTVQKTVEFPLLELLLDKVVDLPVGVQRQLLVPTAENFGLSAVSVHYEV